MESYQFRKWCSKKKLMNPMGVDRKIRFRLNKEEH